MALNLQYYASAIYYSYVCLQAIRSPPLSLIVLSRSETEMKLPLSKIALTLTLLCLYSLPTLADALPAEGCNASFTICVAIEGQTLVYPGCCGISGDVLLTNDGTLGGTLDALFRINNDLIDTGGGTGLGLTAFLFGSADGSAAMPFSVNDISIVFGVDNGTGVPLLNVPGYVETEFIGNGTMYELFTTPEPASWEMLGITLLALGGLAMARKRQSQLNT